jgi:hypothetical protein
MSAKATMLDDFEEGGKRRKRKRFWKRKKGKGQHKMKK